jgi:signal peptidase II
MGPRELVLKTTIVATLVLAVDQAMKVLVRETLAVCSAPPASACDRFHLAGPLGLVRVENAGSTLGFFQGLWVWIFIAALGLALIPLYARRLGATGWVPAVALGLQAGGALGNLVDRAVFGAATDFIDVGAGIVFNPADVALLAGMALAFGAFRRSRREPSLVEVTA